VKTFECPPTLDLDAVGSLEPDVVVIDTTNPGEACIASPQRGTGNNYAHSVLLNSPSCALNDQTQPLTGRCGCSAGVFVADMLRPPGGLGSISIVPTASSIRRRNATPDISGPCGSTQIEISVYGYFNTEIPGKFKSGWNLIDHKVGSGAENPSNDSCDLSASPVTSAPNRVRVLASARFLPGDLKGMPIEVSLMAGPPSGEFSQCIQM
jgi:hypothetical protein